MTSVQYEVAVPMGDAKPPIKPVDKTSENGVYSIQAARIHVTPALAEIARLMREIRATGKCGMMVIRWDRQAWSLHKCEPPSRMNE